MADVLTPPSILAVLAAGYRPQWHPSAGDAARYQTLRRCEPVLAAAVTNQQNRVAGGSHADTSLAFDHAGRDDAADDREQRQRSIEARGDRGRWPRLPQVGKTYVFAYIATFVPDRRCDKET